MNRRRKEKEGESIMKRAAWISVFMVLIALGLAACNAASTPTGGPAGPQPGIGVPNNQPGGPQPGGPQPGGPQPGGVQPGGVQIDFYADSLMLQSGQCTNLHWAVQGAFSVRLDGQPVDPNGQRQVCPQATSTYRLEADAGDHMELREVMIQVGGGNTPVPTHKSGGGTGPTSTPITPSGQKATSTPTTPSGRKATIGPISPRSAKIFDLGLVNIFGNSTTGKIMATVRNTGNQPWIGTFTLTCTGDWRTCDVCAYASSSQTESASIDVGAIYNLPTGLNLNSKLDHQAVKCELTGVSNDSNGSNNSYGPVAVK
jgi:hypothetical protein